MIIGQVSQNGVPWIELQVAGQNWRAVIDTGFNGHLELPLSLQTQVNARFVGRDWKRMSTWLTFLLTANLFVLQLLLSMSDRFWLAHACCVTMS